MDKISYQKIEKSVKELLLKFVNSDGLSIRNAAENLGINYANARKIVAKYKKEKESLLKTITKRGAPRKMDSAMLEQIDKISSENSAYTIKEMGNIIYQRTGTRLSIGSVAAGLQQLKITLKKANYVHDRVNSTNTLSLRATYATHFSNNAPSSPKKCIFIDESGFNYHMRRTAARSRAGSRAVIRIPVIRGRIQSLIIAACGENIVHSKLINDGTCNGPKFLIFVQELMSVLDTDPSYSGAWLIMDNARIHHIESVRVAVSTSQYSLHFLSPYSYMLNPVEHIFSKVKIAVRSRMTALHINGDEVNISALINEALGGVTREDCLGYFSCMARNVALALQQHVFE